MQAPRPSLIARALIALIMSYRNSLRLFMLPTCRFIPTCSTYAEEALQKRGALRGMWDTVRRLLRCHPFAKGGWDPLS